MVVVIGRLPYRLVCSSYARGGRSIFDWRVVHAKALALGAWVCYTLPNITFGARMCT
jgi:hypothetical protein